MAKKSNEKKVSVFYSGQAPFYAAHSQYPFLEDSNTHPDYVFYENGDRYWCVRIGVVEVPWGFGEAECGFWANGVLRFQRRNEEADLDGKGMPFRKEGDVFYLYDCLLGNNGYEGFSIYMRDRLLPIIKRMARESKDIDDFMQAINNLGSHSELVALLGSDIEMAKENPIRIDGIAKEKNSK